MRFTIATAQGQHLSVNFQLPCFHSSSYFPDSLITKDMFEVWRIQGYSGCV